MYIYIYTYMYIYIYICMHVINVFCKHVFRNDDEYEYDPSVEQNELVLGNTLFFVKMTCHDAARCRIEDQFSRCKPDKKRPNH